MEEGAAAAKFTRKGVVVVSLLESSKSAQGRRGATVMTREDGSIVIPIAAVPPYRKGIYLPGGR